MDISLSELKEKEIINVFDGKKLGRIIDILFDIENGLVRGIVVPGERKVFKKSEDIFIPLERLRKIGDDVVLVKLQTISEREYGFHPSGYDKRKGKQASTSNYYNFGRIGYQNQQEIRMEKEEINKDKSKSQSQSINGSYVRFKPINNKKYK